MKTKKPVKATKKTPKKPTVRKSAFTKLAKTLTIKRSKWMCGKKAWKQVRNYDGAGTYDSDQSALLNEEEGLFCCLGFASLDANYSEEEIAGVSDPSCLADKEKMLAAYPWLLHEEKNNSADCVQAIHINDDRDITDKQREQRLKELFKSNGVQLRFVP